MRSPTTIVPEGLGAREVGGEVVQSSRARKRSETRERLFEASGWLSRIIQHEYDHLEGRLFIDRMSPADRIRIKKELKALRERRETDGLLA